MLTREQVMEWAKESGAYIYGDTICKNGDCDDFAMKLATLAYTAGQQSCKIILKSEKIGFYGL